MSEFKVGYKKPPKEHQFKPKNQASVLAETDPPQLENGLAGRFDWRDDSNGSSD